MKRTLAFLFSVTLMISANAQTKSIKSTPPLSESSPQSVGMSAERFAAIDNMLTQSIEKNQIPGVVALIARNGKIVYYKAFGLADNETKRNLKRDDIFRIASQSKAITATAVMMLWEEGKFRLDDPISKFIPEFANAHILDSLNDTDTTYITRPATGEITIRHLLTHTSGIGYGIIDNDQFSKIYQKAGIVDLFTTTPITIGENIKKLARLPLHHDPGKQFTYSEGLDVLGYLIEVLSGKPFDEFLQERIFEPLGMNDTYFYLPESKNSRLVPVQTIKDDKWIRYTNINYDTDYPIKGSKTFFSGGAGLSSTAKDYATFLQMYLNNGELNGVRLLSRTTVQVIMANQIGDLLGGSGAGYGLAFGVINQDGQNMGGRGSIGTFNWGGYFNTQYFADPEENIIGILMKQTQDIKGDETSWKFSQLVGQAIDD
jgi:CubicO group peptidase (beta-lactamase class C family)